MKRFKASWRSTSGQAISHLYAIQRHQTSLDAEFQHSWFISNMHSITLKGLKIEPATESLRRQIEGRQLIIWKYNSSKTDFIHALPSPRPPHFFLNVTSRHFTYIILSYKSISCPTSCLEPKPNLDRIANPLSPTNTHKAPLCTCNIKQPLTSYNLGWTTTCNYDWQLLFCGLSKVTIVLEISWKSYILFVLQFKVWCQCIMAYIKVFLLLLMNDDNFWAFLGL